MITEEITSAPALVAGEWIEDGPTAERVGPYLRRVVTSAVTATSADVTRAVQYAPAAAQAVARVAPAARADALDRAAQLAAERRDQLATQLAVELGKPLKDGRGEIDRVADTLAVCAAEARRIGGGPGPATAATCIAGAITGPAARARSRHTACQLTGWL